LKRTRDFAWAPVGQVGREIARALTGREKRARIVVVRSHPAPAGNDDFFQRQVARQRVRITDVHAQLLGDIVLGRGEKLSVIARRREEIVHRVVPFSVADVPSSLDID